MADRGTVKKPKTDSGAGSSKGNLKVKDPEVRTCHDLDPYMEDDDLHAFICAILFKCRPYFPRLGLFQKSLRSRRKRTG